MKHKNELIELLSDYLFWDIDINDIDVQKHKKYIIKKVLQYGTYSDWKITLKFYGKTTIINIAKTITDLDKKTVSFLSAISGVPKTEFLCYTTKQSTPKHWNF